MISAKDKLACVKRKLNMRLAVYPRWVRNGKMSQKQAQHELEVMHAIMLDYEREANQLSLNFTGEE